MYAVRCTGQIANLRGDGTGTTNVLLFAGTPEERLITFSSRPTYMETVPPEIEAYPHVVVTELPAKDWKRMQAAGAKVLDLERLPLRAVPAPAATTKPPRTTKAAIPADVPLTPDRQTEVERVRQAIANVGPKTAEVLVRAGYGLDDTRRWGSIRHLPDEELAALGLQPAQVKAVAAWRDSLAPDPDLGKVEAQLKAERIQ